MKNNKHSKEDCIKAIQDFYAKHQRNPKAKIDHLGIGTNTFLRRFGSWNKALEAAGLSPTMTMNQRVDLVCLECKKSFSRKPSEASKSQNHFCSSSCAATYNNKNKSCGTRRSKLETWLEEELKKLYPDLSMIFNGREAIQAELDIYMPSLALAFELNGIFHYEPIFGEDKLSRIQNNDDRKFQACLEAGIELCIIDTSGLSYSIPKNMKKYLDIIKSITDTKIAQRNSEGKVRFELTYRL